MAATACDGLVMRYYALYNTTWPLPHGLPSRIPPLLRVMIQPGIYLHYKGKQYEVIGRALHSETLEAFVVYKPLYPTPDVPEGSLWVRPEAMFSEMVMVDGVEVPRFRPLGG